MSVKKPILAMTLAAIAVAAQAGKPAASTTQRLSSFDFATYLGGPAADDINAVAVASNGDYVVCGSTDSTGLATPGVVQAALAGGESDLFVSRLAPDGSGIVFTTYFGGSDGETCSRVELDGAGNIVFAGHTESSDFPTPNGFDTTYAGAIGGDASPFNQDAYVAKLSGDGTTVVFSTYVGGMDLGGDPLFGNETIRGLHIDAAGAIYVAGNTSAADFPATTILHDRDCGADAVGGSSFVTDAFVAKLASDGSLVFATCFGGTARDTGRGVRLTGSGAIVTIGHSRSDDFPVTAGAVDTGPGSSPFDYDTTVTILNSTGTAILAAARIGGDATEFLQDVELDSQGRIVVVGSTNSTDFPTSANALQDTFASPLDDSGFASTFDGIVYRLSPALDTLQYASYVGGIGDDSGSALEIDGFDQAFALINTSSFGLPVPNAAQAQKGADVHAPVVPNLANTGARAAATGRSGFGSDELFIVLAGDGPNRLYRSTEGNTPVADGSLGVESAATYALFVGDLNFDGMDDVVTGNRGAESYVYLNDGTGGFQAGIPFGVPDRNATGGVGYDVVGLTAADVDGLGVLDIVQVNDGQPNVYFPFDGFSVGPAVAFGSGVDASRAVDSAAGGLVIETVAPDRLLFHQVFGGTVTTTERTLGGSLLGDLDLADINGDFIDELILANGLGGALAIFEEPGAGYSGAPVEIGANAPATQAVGAIQGVGVATTHSDGIRYYRYDAINETFDQLQFVATPAQVDALRPAAGFGIILAGGGAAAADQFLAVGIYDNYLAGFDLDEPRALLGSYVGATGEDAFSFGLARAADGAMVVASASRSDDFPTTSASQPTNAGGLDGLIVRLSYPVDGDSDGVSDLADNCSLIANADQRDTNGDGYGNVCDTDLNNDEITNAVDLGLFKAVFFTADADADFNGDGIVNVLDLGTLKAFFFAAPGPSALAP